LCLEPDQHGSDLVFAGLAVKIGRGFVEEIRLDQETVQRAYLKLSGSSMQVVVTGALGFMGLNFINRVKKNHHCICLDQFEPEGLAKYPSGTQYYTLDLAGSYPSMLDRHEPDVIVHFAAQSHVDRSVFDPQEAIRNNVLSTQYFLDYCVNNGCRFILVSTDEVFGDLEPDEGPFTEDSPYRPSSPYAASKASCDMMVHSYIRTYGLNGVILNSTNNYGPYQLKDKLIPKMINHLRLGEDLPMYSGGQQVRDWMHVYDFCDLIELVMDSHETGQFVVGADDQYTNQRLTQKIVWNYVEVTNCRASSSKIVTVDDRPCHNRRCHVDATKVMDTFGWKPIRCVQDDLYDVVRWYVNHEDWFTLERTWPVTRPNLKQ
jgi:dTDP-glucose 4,6-dehydratase